MRPRTRSASGSASCASRSDTARWPCAIQNASPAECVSRSTGGRAGVGATPPPRARERERWRERWGEKESKKETERNSGGGGEGEGERGRERGREETWSRRSLRCTSRARSGVYEPAGHAMHSVRPAAAATAPPRTCRWRRRATSRWVPDAATQAGVHASHAAAPASAAYVPLGQTSQSSAARVDDVPAPQSSHADVPDELDVRCAGARQAERRGDVARSPRRTTSTTTRCRCWARSPR